MKLEIYRDTEGQYRWRRRALNGAITAQGESHRRKWNAKRAARKAFPNDRLVDLTRRGSLATRRPDKR